MSKRCAGSPDVEIHVFFISNRANGCAFDHHPSLNPRRLRNVCTCVSVVVLPAFGTPANSMTNDLRAFSANCSAARSARVWRFDFMDAWFSYSRLSKALESSSISFRVLMGSSRHLFHTWVFCLGWVQSTIRNVAVQPSVRQGKGSRKTRALPAREGGGRGTFPIKSLDARCLTGYIYPFLNVRLQSARHSETLVWKLGATLTNRRPVFRTTDRPCAGEAQAQP